MSPAPSSRPNVRQAVPLLGVASMEASLRFYRDGLGGRMTKSWSPEGRLRWCWIALGEAALMLQEFWTDGAHPGRPEGRLGQGVTLCFLCADALAIYRKTKARGLAPSEPFVGNRLWVTSLADPDGYRLDFESPTDVAEETTYAQWLAQAGAS